MKITDVQFLAEKRVTRIIFLEGTHLERVHVHTLIMRANHIAREFPPNSLISVPGKPHPDTPQKIQDLSEVLYELRIARARVLSRMRRKRHIYRLRVGTLKLVERDPPEPVRRKAATGSSLTTSLRYSSLLRYYKHE